MSEQHYAFCDNEQRRFVLTTMATVAIDGTPVDPDSGDDYEYFGPVLWESQDYGVAVDPDTHRLAIIASDGRVSLLNCKAQLKGIATRTDRCVLAIVLEGGLVQAVITDRPERFTHTRFVILDHDIEGASQDELHTVHLLDESTPQTAAVRMIDLEPARIDLSTLLKQIDTDPR